jgi:hypothetical protein
MSVIEILIFFKKDKISLISGHPFEYNLNPG